MSIPSDPGRIRRERIAAGLPVLVTPENSARLRAHATEYAALGVSQGEVRRWLNSRGITWGSGVPPRAAFEGFVKAHPQRFPTS